MISRGRKPPERDRPTKPSPGRAADEDAERRGRLSPRRGSGIPNASFRGLTPPATGCRPFGPESICAAHEESGRLLCGRRGEVVTSGGHSALQLW